MEALKVVAWQEVAEGAGWSTALAAVLSATPRLA